VAIAQGTRARRDAITNTIRDTQSVCVVPPRNYAALTAERGGPTAGDRWLAERGSEPPHKIPPRPTTLPPVRPATLTPTAMV
jgi:hypothetical protein